jgi:hypothetical protein
MSTIPVTSSNLIHYIIMSLETYFHDTIHVNTIFYHQKRGQFSVHKSIELINHVTSIIII